MRITSKGVTFEGCYGSNMNTLAGRIHFTDDTMVDVYLHPSILAMLIGVCAHDLKLKSTDITKLIKILHDIGDDYTRGLKYEKLAETFKQTTQEDKLQYTKGFIAGMELEQLESISKLCKRQLEIYHHLRKEKDNGRVSERKGPIKRTMVAKKRNANKPKRSTGT